MLRPKEQQSIEFKCIRNGNGDTEMHKILNGAEDDHLRETPIRSGDSVIIMERGAGISGNRGGTALTQRPRMIETSSGDAFFSSLPAGQRKHFPDEDQHLIQEEFYYESRVYGQISPFDVPYPGQGRD